MITLVVPSCAPHPPKIFSASAIVAWSSVVWDVGGKAPELVCYQSPSIALSMTGPMLESIHVALTSYILGCPRKFSRTSSAFSAVSSRVPQHSNSSSAAATCGAPSHVSHGLPAKLLFLVFSAELSRQRLPGFANVPLFRTQVAGNCRYIDPAHSRLGCSFWFCCCG